MPVYRETAMWGQSENEATCVPRRVTSQRTKAANTLTLAIQLPELGRQAHLLSLSRLQKAHGQWN